MWWYSAPGLVPGGSAMEATDRVPWFRTGV